jgi:hypothetical protein
MKRGGIPRPLLLALLFMVLIDLPLSEEERARAVVSMLRAEYEKSRAAEQVVRDPVTGRMKEYQK